MLEEASIVSATGTDICIAVLKTVDDIISIYWKSVYKISRIWLGVVIFTSFYLESRIWPDAISGSWSEVAA
jgi:hypothetical protein